MLSSRIRAGCPAAAFRRPKSWPCPSAALCGVRPIVARRGYLTSSVFQFEHEDRQQVAALLQERHDEEQRRAASAAPADAVAVADDDRRALEAAKVAADLAKIWVNDTATSSSEASIGTQVADDGDDTKGGLFNGKELRERAIAMVRQHIPETYGKHVDDVIRGAQAKKNNERLQEALLRKHAARVDIEAARAKVTDAQAREAAWLREEPRRGDRPDFGSVAHDLWDRRRVALRAAVRDAEATELVVRACMEVQEAKLRLDEEKSGVYELATYVAKYSYAAASVIVIALFQLAAGLFWLWRYWRGVTPNQRLRGIAQQLADVDARIAASSSSSSIIAAAAPQTPETAGDGDAAVDTSITAPKLLASMERRVRDLEAALDAANARYAVLAGSFSALAAETSSGAAARDGRAAAGHVDAGRLMRAAVDVCRRAWDTEMQLVQASLRITRA